MDDFFEYWDKILKYWREEEGRIPKSQKFWFDEQNHLGLHRLLMPEPYWGNIDNNSVVFINFNPAGAETATPDDDSHISQKENPEKVCGWLSPEYSKVAVSFPLLANDPEDYKHYKGAEWWQKRVKWMNQFGIEDNDVKPFAIELCAWHSKKWTGGKYQSKLNSDPEIKTYIKEQFGPWLERALKGSEYHLALCVGKEFADNVIPLIWPESRDITKEITGKIDHTIVNGNARKFWVFAIDGLGHIICTSAQGSNNIPSSAIFGQHEKNIFEKIKSKNF